MYSTARLNHLALADLFFPQLGLYLEVDEDHHRIPQNILADARRRRHLRGHWD